MNVKALIHANDYLLRALAILQSEGCSVADDVKQVSGGLSLYIACIPCAEEIDREAAKQPNIGGGMV